MLSGIFARTPLTTPVSNMAAVRMIMLDWTRKERTRVPRRSGLRMREAREKTKQPRPKQKMEVIDLAHPYGCVVLCGLAPPRPRNRVLPTLWLVLRGKAIEATDEVGGRRTDQFALRRRSRKHGIWCCQPCRR